MQITKDKVASIHYTLKNSAGKVIDSSAGSHPLTYLHGAGNLIPGMESGLEGKVVGNKFDLVIQPEHGYGLKDDRLIQQVPRANFGDQKIEMGMQFQTNRGSVVTVTKVGLESITVDGNHPLAGEVLSFAVEVMEVRNATADEIAHGHVHGVGGHHH